MDSAIHLSNNRPQVYSLYTGSLTGELKGKQKVELPLSCLIQGCWPQSVNHILHLVKHWWNTPLNGLVIKIFLLSWHVIWSHDSNFLSSRHNAREDTTESVEATFVIRGNHFWNVHAQWPLAFTSYNKMRLVNGLMYSMYKLKGLASWQPVREQTSRRVYVELCVSCTYILLNQVKILFVES